MVGARPRCWHLAFLTTVFNVLLWMFLLMNTKSSVPDHIADKRILLSYEYAEPKINPEQTVEPVNTGSSSSVDPIPTSQRIKQEEIAPAVEKSEKVTDPLTHIKTEEKDFIKFNSNQGILDKYRLFKTHSFTKTGKMWNKLSQNKICLGTQTSVDRLYHLVDILKGWSGPLSLALFVPDIELAIAKRYISYLTKCFTNIDQQVSFHVVVPVDHPGVYSYYPFDEFNSEQLLLDCKEHKQYLKQLLSYRTEDMMKWRTSYSYPQNLLRNVAKSGCQTEFTYVPDIDMVLPAGMDDRLEAVMSTQEVSDCEKCAYVIPTYEISDSLKTFPTSKVELLELVKNKTARAFHSKLFNINQKSSMLSEKWEKTAVSEKEIGYKVEKYIFKYEPLYIARADSPQFDERFIGFGMTRNTQVYEMYVAGYDFYVMANIFTNHAGFQTLSARPSWRAKQQEVNNAKFDEFAKELSAHYGRDPYNMLEKLPKMNLKNIHVAYSTSKKKKPL